MISRRNLLKTLLGGAALASLPVSLVPTKKLPLVVGTVRLAVGHGEWILISNPVRPHAFALFGQVTTEARVNGQEADFIARFDDRGERGESPEFADRGRDQDGLRVGAFAG